MSLFPTRLRTRHTPHPSGGRNVYLGRFQIKINDVWKTFAGNKPGDGSYHPNGCPSLINYPFSKHESTLDELHKGPPYIEGGEFYSVKLACDDPILGVGSGTYGSGTTTWTLSGFGNGVIRYQGYFSNPDFSGLGVPDITVPVNQYARGSLMPNIETLCSSAWDKTKPRIERAGLAVALGEMRDTPRMLSTSSKVFSTLWKTHLKATLGLSSTTQSYRRYLSMREMAPKKVADHFINHNFGWVPFVSDVTKFCDVAINNQEIIDRLSGENDKWVRRRATLVNDSKLTKLSSGTGTRVEPFGAYLDSLCNGVPTWELWLDETTISSAVGSFRYFRPEFDKANPEFNSLINSARRQLAIHGFRISPANIYRIIPWSWAVDWFSNTGKWVNHINDEFLDSLVAKYLFVHHRRLKRYVLKQTIPFKDGGPRTFEFVREIETKQRKAADTPYGFGLGWGDLSPKQMAILIALGISRR